MGALRSGSATAARLFREETSPAVWHGIHENYEVAVRAIGLSKKKEKELTQWDSWWRNELPKILASRQYMNKEDLVKVDEMFHGNHLF